MNKKIEKIIKNKLLLGIIILFLIILFLGLFIIDIGINSKYFIKRTFNIAYSAYQTGNCKLLKKYTETNNNWELKCNIQAKLVLESKLSFKSIGSFSIKTISYNFPDDRAFLLVNVSKYDSNGKFYTESERIEMKKTGLAWKID